MKNSIKISFKEFNDKINEWYDKTRPSSGKPRPHLRNSFYELYLKGQDFKFL